MEDLDKLIPRVSRLDDETSDGVRARESRTKRRSSRGIARFLVAICIGVAGTLAWQSYGQAAKQMLAAKAPELGWSPESKQMHLENLDLSYLQDCREGYLIVRYHQNPPQRLTGVFIGFIGARPTRQHVS
jgi:hypothetical protein